MPKTDQQKHIREYLAEIGRRGGENSRRDLFRSHARRMVEIREMKRAAVRAGKPWPPRDRRTLKLLKLTQTSVASCLYRKPLMIDD